MKSVRYIGVLFALLSCGLLPALAQQPSSHSKSTSGYENGGILYGDRWAFFVEAGKGWVLDEQAGEAQGVSAVFYRKGESWANGVAVMYITVEPRRNRSLKTIIQQDIIKQQQMFPSAQPKPQPSLSTADHTSAIIYAFQPNTPGKSAWERVAYVNNHNSIVMLVLTARTQAAFRQAEPNFNTLVHSFQWMDVQNKRK